MHVLIAGAGIGGLTAALSLQKIGVEVTVFESVATVSPLGVGINILPHASRELIALGLQSESEQIFEFPVYDRHPLKRWTFGRVTLSGDAAHPFIPVSSSGAVHAIIDGRALASALASSADPEKGLQVYEADRLNKANQVILASRQNGPDEVLEIVRNECPEDAGDIHDYIPADRLQSVIDDFKEKSGFGIDTLNNSPSYNV